MEKTKPTRILLVEDEVIIRIILIDLLEENGFDVLAAASGDEALPLLTDPDHIDLLFTDVQMPGHVDGIDLAMHVRKHYPATPILISSGYALKLRSRLNELQPPPAFITKPFTLKTVIEKVEELMR